MKNNWIKLTILNNLKDIIRIFGNIFLSTYFFKITDGNITKIFIYWIIYSASNLIYRYAICRKMNSSNVIKFYRMSILLNFIMVCILLLMNKNIVNYMFLYALIQSFSISLYYASYENIIVALNKKKNFKKYFSIDNLLSNIVTSLIPLSLGILIEKSSYIIAFIILLIITIICVVYSIFLNSENIECYPINIREYKKTINNKKLYIKMMIQNFFDGFNTWGPMGVLTTLLIYSKFSSESIVGGINSASNILGIIASFLCIKLINKKNFSKIVIPITVIIFLLTIPISFKATSILVCAYALLNNIGIVITDINGNSLTYELMEKITKKERQNDYLWNIQVVFDLGRIFGYLLVLLVSVYNFEYLKYLFIIFSFGFIIRTLIISNLNKE